MLEIYTGNLCHSFSLSRNKHDGSGFATTSTQSLSFTDPLQGIKQEKTSHLEYRSCCHHRSIVRTTLCSICVSTKRIISKLIQDTTVHSNTLFTQALVCQEHHNGRSIRTTKMLNAVNEATNLRYVYAPQILNADTSRLI
jgi:hypothetical protein